MTDDAVDLSLKFLNVKSKHLSAELLTIDDDRGNPYRQWVQAGKPQTIDRKMAERLNLLSSESLLPEKINIRHSGNRAEVDLILPSPSVKLIRIRETR
jgi:beta-xylosidase